MGHQAPAIAGTALDGSAVSLAGLRGHPVVVNFWASWCIPCRDEFPMFQDKLDGPRPGRRAGGPGRAVQGRGRPRQVVRDRLRRHLAHGHRPDGTIADAYRIAAPPQTFFIDKDGVIRAIQIGQMTADVFDTQYAKIKP